eukprot:2792386-Heterocapsa_arctica.AAC.1
MHELLAEHERSRGPTTFVPGVPTTTSPTVRLTGGASPHPSPALVLGPSSAGYGTGPTPFVRVSDNNPITRTMPGGGDATGAVPAI